MQGVIQKKLNEEKLVTRETHLPSFRAAAWLLRTDALGTFMEMAHI